MDLRGIAAALKRGWWLLALGAVAAGAAAFGVSSQQTALYTTGTELFVSATDSTTTSAALQGSQFSQQRISSYVQLIGSVNLAQRVIDRLGLDMTPGQLRSEISAGAVPNTVLIDVSVTDPSPRRAQQIATAVGEEFGPMVEQLETPDRGGSSPVKITVTTPPGLPTFPSSPRTKRTVIFAALGGLVLGTGIAIGRGALDRSVKDPREASRLAEVPVLGRIVRDRSLKNGRLSPHNAATRTTEDYRRLKNHIQYLFQDAPSTVLMVSSPLPADGKTTLAVNLGMALADSGRTVSVVEADLRRPSLARTLGLADSRGLVEVLTGAAGVDDVKQTYGDSGLQVVPAGEAAPDPGQLLGSRQMLGVLDKLRAENEFVLVDAAPLGPVADSTSLAGYVDGVVVVVRYGRVTRDQLRQAVAELRVVGGKILGLVINAVPPKAAKSPAAL